MEKESTVAYFSIYDKLLPMIPRIIELKNFLSYGDEIQTIDFKDHSLICLSGKNGHGKSALLDALTWALWGQARKITGQGKADEGLLRLGQTRMMVCVEFEFGQQVYRVRREYAKTYGKPYSALDFEIFDQTRSAYASLTDKTVRATQEKIEQLLGLDYETFINTSFLRQGQANEFSKKNPKERKQILATILGFSKYDLLQQQAVDTSRKLHDEKKLLTQLIEQAQQELNLSKPYTEQLTQEQQAGEKIAVLINTMAMRIQDKERERAFFIELKNLHTTLSQEQRETQQKTNQKIELLHSLVFSWKNVHKTTLNLPNLKELEEQKRLLTQQEKYFLEVRQKNIALQEQELAIKQQLQNNQNTLRAELDKNIYSKRLELEKQALLLQQKKTLLEQKQALLKDLGQKHTTLTHELLSLQKSKKELEASVRDFPATKKQFEKRRTFYQTLISKGNWLKNTLQESDQKKHIVDDISSPSCPLCEQLLTAKRKQLLGAKLLAHDHFLRHQINRVSSVIKKLKELLLDQHKIIEQQEKEHEALRMQTEQERTLTTTLAELTPACDQIVAEIITLQKQQEDGSLAFQNNTLSLQKMEKEGLDIIAQNTEIKRLSLHLALIEEEKNSNAYNHDDYVSLQQKIKTVDEAINHVINLGTQREQQAMKRAHVHHLIEELKELKKLQKQQDDRLAQIATQLPQEDRIAQEYEALKKELSSLQEQKETNARQQARLETDLKRIEMLRQTCLDKQTHIDKLDQEIDDYQTLAQALGKNGLQALLIEEAIPEIELEANRLLARLTDNQAQIFIESLRDLKSGGVKETLDIHISDTAGIRPYEMYSGGEAFRVDFALRIAISKLLAQRAGTALQTLIVDEGFGSQDEEGLTRITEALYTIKSDFSKIIIVSHLPEMKDSFPVHFIVEKQASGSVVIVEERG